MHLNCGVGEDSWESLGLTEDPTNPSYRKLVLNIHWKDWCLSWNSFTLATWCEELTHLKRPWSWERLKAGGERDIRGWDGWMASPTWWTWVWAGSRSCWWMGRPSVLQSMGLQIVRHDWATKLNWYEWLSVPYLCPTAAAQLRPHICRERTFSLLLGSRKDKVHEYITKNHLVFSKHGKAHCCKRHVIF